MALPFILGLAVGATAVVAYNKSDKLKNILSSSIDKTKENVEDIKDTLVATKDCIKEKKNDLKDEIVDTIEDIKEEIKPVKKAKS